jgi:TPR repeat protein
MNDFSEQLNPEVVMSLQSGIAAFEAKHFARAQQLLYPLAEHGHPEAQYRMAIMAQNGLGMVVNNAAAVGWMRAAAEQGHAFAQHGLGFMYMSGECVEHDDEKAVHWFRQAAEQGLVGAQAALGSMYEQGRGVAQDLAEAQRWYQKAGF